MAGRVSPFKANSPMKMESEKSPNSWLVATRTVKAIARS